MRSCVRPNSSTKAAYASASSTALRSSRATFSASAISSEEISSAGRTSAGMYSRPASFGGAQAALAGDQFEAYARGRRRAFGARLLRVQRPHHDRLHHAERLDRGGQLLQFVVLERPSRLPPVDADVGQRQLPQPALAEGRRGAGAAERGPALSDERPEALAQRLLAAGRPVRLRPLGL